MPEIQPFRAITYSKRADLSRLLCPPYDIVTSLDRERLDHLETHNFINLILPEGIAAYQHSRQLLDEWLAAGMLQQRPAPALYVYRQTFEFGSELYTRTALIASVRATDYSEGKVLPHEYTHKHAKEDRLHLIEATRANLDCVLGLYSDASGTVAGLLAEGARQGELLIDSDDPMGCRNELFEMTEPALLARLQEALASTVVVIGDGHHRYETALNYRDSRRQAAGQIDLEAPWEFVMMALVAEEDPGLCILPTHRIIDPGEALGGVEEFLEALAGDFNLKLLDAPAVSRWEQHRAPGGFVVCLSDGRRWLAEARGPEAMAEAAPDRSEAWRALDVALSQELVLKKLLKLSDDELLHKVEYVKSRRLLARRLAETPRRVGLMMGKPDVSAILKVAVAGEKMPQKSTYIEPKLTSGLLLRLLD